MKDTARSRAMRQVYLDAPHSARMAEGPLPVVSPGTRWCACSASASAARFMDAHSAAITKAVVEL